MTKTEEIEALRNEIANLRTYNENQANTIAGWRKRFYEEVESSAKQRDSVLNMCKEQIANLKKHYEEHLRNTRESAVLVVEKVMNRAADMLAEQEAHFLLEIEKARTNTLAQAFDHVVTKLAER